MRVQPAIAGGSIEPGVERSGTQVKSQKIMPARGRATAFIEFPSRRPLSRASLNLRHGTSQVRDGLSYSFLNQLRFVLAFVWLARPEETL